VTTLQVSVFGSSGEARGRYHRAMTDPRVGATLCGKYRIDRVLGEGGMGIVYAATHLRIGRRVAIKFLHGPALKNQGVVERFFAEARSAGSLRHPNVIDVLDLDSDENGVPFMVLEFLEGEPLSNRIAREPRLTLAEIQAIFGPILDALAAAHERGIVHRDLKPDNIFLSQVGGELVPKLLDFGIAKLRDGGSATHTGTLLGTPMYMSPEQARGAMREIGPCTDIWAMGVVLFECATGESPFGFEPGTSPFVQVARIATEAPATLGAVRPDASGLLIASVDGALRRDAGDRFANARAMRSTLLGASGAGLAPTVELTPDANHTARAQHTPLTRGPVAVAPTLAISEPSTPKRAHYAAAALAVLLAFVAIAGVARWLVRSTPLPPPLAAVVTEPPVIDPPSPPAPRTVEPPAMGPVADDIALVPTPAPAEAPRAGRPRVRNQAPAVAVPGESRRPVETRTGEWNTNEL